MGYSRKIGCADGDLHPHPPQDFDKYAINVVKTMFYYFCQEADNRPREGVLRERDAGM
jgi:hypothetical protein